MTYAQHAARVDALKVRLAECTDPNEIMHAAAALAIAEADMYRLRAALAAHLENELKQLTGDSKHADL